MTNSNAQTACASVPADWNCKIKCDEGFEVPEGTTEALCQGDNKWIDVPACIGNAVASHRLYRYVGRRPFSLSLDPLTPSLSPPSPTYKMSTKHAFCGSFKTKYLPNIPNMLSNEDCELVSSGQSCKIACRPGFGKFGGDPVCYRGEWTDAPSCGTCDLLVIVWLGMIPELAMSSLFESRIFVVSARLYVIPLYL